MYFSIVAGQVYVFNLRIDLGKQICCFGTEAVLAAESAALSWLKLCEIRFQSIPESRCQVIRISRIQEVLNVVECVDHAAAFVTMTDLKAVLDFFSS